RRPKNRGERARFSCASAPDQALANPDRFIAYQPTHRRLKDSSAGLLISGIRAEVFMSDVRLQAIAGLTPPDIGEAKVREAWPSVAKSPAIASLGKLLTSTIILAPLAWLLMSLVYFGKLLPFAATRYTLTNRRVMIRKGLTGKCRKEVPLA